MVEAPALRPVDLGVADLAGALGSRLLALNNAHAVELSWLEAEGLARLVAGAFWAGRVGDGAMLVSFDQDADYGSPNFQWFRGRFGRFVYVDRVVVSAGLRGRGVARALYGAVMARARAAGHERVVCEVNVEPANEGSLRLHEGLGFRAVGDGVPMVGKRVVYLELGLGVEVVDGAG